MRALTVRQPWATLLILGYKHYETRSQPTNVRGQIAIHAGKAMPFPEGRVWSPHPEIDIEHAPDGLWMYAYGIRERLPLGAIVGTCDLVDCIPTSGGEHGSDITQLEHALGDWTPGRFGWRIDNPTELHPSVPARGKQGWWDWTPEVGA